MPAQIPLNAGLTYVATIESFQGIDARPWIIKVVSSTTSTPPSSDHISASIEDDEVSDKYLDRIVSQLDKLDVRLSNIEGSSKDMAVSLAALEARSEHALSKESFWKWQTGVVVAILVSAISLFVKMMGLENKYDLSPRAAVQPSAATASQPQSNPKK